MTEPVSKMLHKNINDSNRQAWLKKTLAGIPAGYRILDAGAGELRNKPLCSHLDYVSQDMGVYDGTGDGTGLQSGRWNTDGNLLLCDIVAIPEADHSFDAILCSEVLEHIPEPTHSLDEFARLLKPGGTLVLTAPFSSLAHLNPYYYSTGFSQYWYEYHLSRRGFDIIELSANGDWFGFCEQELTRLGSTARKYGDWKWPLGYLVGGLGKLYFTVRSGRSAPDLACFGWNCLARKR